MELKKASLKNRFFSRLLFCCIFGLVLVPSDAHSSPQRLSELLWDDVTTDDSDLSSGFKINTEEVPLNLGPDRIEIEATADGSTILELQILRPDLIHLPVDGLQMNFSANGVMLGQAHTWNGGKILISCNGANSFVGSAQLVHEKFRIRQTKGSYSLRVEGRCGYHNKFIFLSESPSGQALGIWRIAFGAAYKLALTVGMDFWRNSVNIVWPGTGDFYRWGTVNLTRGDHWDVVGHELGHAIYDLANIGRFGGGQHFIDQCYSGALALSEGWASYFSAWLSVALDHPDAQFEFMVPRRAPVRFEYVPEDVCWGPNNEWRVNAYFWDVVDLNSDGEGMNESFAKVWHSLFRSNVANVEQAHDRLLRAGFDSTKLDFIWNLNFRGVQ